MKNYLLILFAFGIFPMAFAQTPPTLTLDIAPYGNSPFWYGETINFDYEWKLDGNIGQLPQFCVESYSVLDNGGAVVVKRPGNNLDVTWGGQKSTTARVNINLTQCSNVSYRGNYPSSNYSVMSILGETPAPITGTGNVAVCQSSPLTYSTSAMSIPNGIDRAVDGYEWTIPVGWKFSDGSISTGTPRLFLGTNGRTQQFTPDCKGLGAVVVRAWTNAEGRGTPHYSLPRSLTITRTPAVLIAVPDEINCGVPFTATATSLACATSYDWTVPSGWQKSGSGSTITITPTGTSGSISVATNLNGGCQIVTSKSISAVFDPKISGNDILCGSSAYQLLDVPEGATVTWSASPANLFATSSGTGSNITLAPANSSVSGQGTLTFNVNSICGTRQIQKPIYVGSPATPTFISSGSNTICDSRDANGETTFYTSTVPGTTTYRFEILNSSGSLEYASNRSVPDFFFRSIYVSGPGNYQIRVRTSNSCGTSNWYTSSFIVLGSNHHSCSDCGRDCLVLLYPNPASDLLNVELVTDEESQKLLESYTGKKEVMVINIYDSLGNEVMGHASENITAELNINKLKSGIYLIHVRYGEYEVKKPLKIEK